MTSATLFSASAAEESNEIAATNAITARSTIDPLPHQNA
jgi:hypothetical protein